MQNSAIPEMSFEVAMEELSGIVRRMESGESSLEQAIGDYTRGTELKNHCESKLKDAELKVQKLVSGEDGAIRAEAFDAAQ